jgi:hypothetical protein
MKIRIILCAAVLSSVYGNQAYALTFSTGAEFYNYCHGAFGAGFLHYGLCHGFIDGMAQRMSNNRRICLPAGVPERATVVAVQDYMRERPDRLGGSPQQITAEALMRAFPCRWRRP